MNANLLKIFKRSQHERETMTTKQADKLIKSGEQVTLHNARFNETFTVVLVSRDRHTVTSQDGGRFERDELEVVE